MTKIVASCIGLVVIAVIGCVITANIGHYTTQTIPTWLPPIPFAVVAIMLFSLGVIIWLRGEKKDGGSRDTPAGS